jgi:hypothetical protein
VRLHVILLKVCGAPQGILEKINALTGSEGSPAYASGKLNPSAAS